MILDRITNDSIKFKRTVLLRQYLSSKSDFVVEMAKESNLEVPKLVRIQPKENSSFTSNLLKEFFDEIFTEINSSEFSQFCQDRAAEFISQMKTPPAPKSSQRPF